MGKISKVWQHFDKLNKQTAKCKICGKICSTAGNTSNLHSHLKNIHEKVLSTVQTNEDNNTQVVVSNADFNLIYYYKPCNG